jgi:hypothetical protein
VTPAPPPAMQNGTTATETGRGSEGSRVALIVQTMIGVLNVHGTTDNGHRRDMKPETAGEGTMRGSLDIESTILGVLLPDL